MKRLLAALLLLFTAPAWGAGPYYVWSGGTSGNCLSWAEACTSFKDLYDTGIGTSGSPLANGEIVYVASDHNDAAATYGGAFTLTGPASGIPVKIISVDRADDSYEIATTDQIDTTDGVYDITFDGSFALWGIAIDGGSGIIFGSDTNEATHCQDCLLKPANANMVVTTGSTRAVFVNTTISGVNDTGSTTNPLLRASGATISGTIIMRGGAFTNLSNRTQAIIGGTSAQSYSYDISGVDFSAVPEGTYLISGSVAKAVVTNSLTASGQSFLVPTSTKTTVADILYTNTGDTDRPWWLSHWTYAGYTQAQTTYTRDNGASIGGTRVAWQYTADLSADGYSYFSPWIYGSVSSTGSKTLTIHIANATDDLTDREAAIECDIYTAGTGPLWTRYTDAAAVTATGTAQADDPISDWDNDLTYMQKLSVTPTIATTGQFRCRVVATTSQGFYIDPKVVVE